MRLNEVILQYWEHLWLSQTISIVTQEKTSIVIRMSNLSKELKIETLPLKVKSVVVEN